MTTKGSESGSPTTRQELIRVAAKLFREKGFHSCSMQEIAAGLGIKKASIYYYIDTKTDLLREISQTAMTMVVESGASIAASDLLPEEKLRRLIAEHTSLVCGNFDLFTVTLRELSSDNTPSFWPDVVELRDRYESILRGIIRSGRESGAFREVDERLTGFALLGMLNWIIRWYSPEGRCSPAELSGVWEDLFLHGLLRQSNSINGDIHKLESNEGVS
jgi:TetR/AcrR family transcriptional regulator, cholesterol catabolism regulator